MGLGKRRKAILLGATGLVGGHCLRRLLDTAAVSSVTVPVRRKLFDEHPKLQQHIVDFARPGDYGPLLQADDFYWCFGTTIKKAGSRAAFRHIDMDLPLGWARAAAARGARRLFLVSALGADPSSRVFYNKIKGEIEVAVSRLAYETVAIFRPSLLLGIRAETRLAERVMGPVFRLLSGVMVGPLRRMRAIEGRDVAAAMVEVSRQESGGVTFYESDIIQSIADRST